MTKELLADLARVKALFQLRAIKAVIDEKPKGTPDVHAIGKASKE